MLTHSIYGAAIIPTVFTVLLVLGIILWRSPRSERPLLVSLFVLELPLFFISMFAIRQPLNRLLASVLPPLSTPGLVLRSFEAPLVEESCKLWLLFLVFRFLTLNADNAIRIGMTVGVSFGVSEIWGLAYMLNRLPALNGFPWYHYSGFIIERILVAPLHGIFVVAASRQIVKGGRHIAFGVLLGMTLHYFANFPIMLAHLDVGHLGKAFWASALTIYVPVYALFMYLLLLWWSYGKKIRSALRQRLGPTSQPAPIGTDHQ